MLPRHSPPESACSTTASRIAAVPVPTLELELMLALTPEEIPHFEWRNAGGVHGWVSSPLQLFDLVRLVGSTHEWTFLVVKDRNSTEEFFTQCSGSADNGFHVEVGQTTQWHAVARTGGWSGPLKNIGTWGWTYWAFDDELHDDNVATGIMWDWLTSRKISEGHEPRRADWRVPPDARY